MKNNKGLIVLVIILSILVLVLGGYLFYYKILSNNDFNENKIQNQISDNTNNEDTHSYKLGDDVVLESLTKVSFKSVGFPDEYANFSNWKVLREEGNYIILYSTAEDVLYGKDDREETIYMFKERKILFTENGIDFGNQGEIRIINEEDLKQFGCNSKTLKCPNAPNWISGWTSLTENNNKFLIQNGELEPIDESTYVLVLSNPVIKILKSNIK